MVGLQRPQFVLFGSSIVQLSFGNGGWGAHLANLYSRKADIVLRGYMGWNSRQALNIVHQVFHKDAVVKPDLAIVYFGGNDSVEPHPLGLSSHVPLVEYIENMRKIVLHIKSLSENMRIIFLTCPPINEERYRMVYGTENVRTNEACQRYSDAGLELCREIGVKAVDLCSAFKARDDWENLCFIFDGVHFSAEGSFILAVEILKVLRDAEWEPSLHWGSMPTEFPDSVPDGQEALSKGLKP
ncbi:GDSL esterase/lipase CPRD49 [Thalictrum thalictroides]|uniref:GDSL esterase/lipase CPRD49 n=1 Tax=Thalictrum thalictroides TaxID=46969 RepID=A0A7J6WUF0_THATH|nr:GDSL esterase/lipase CPRD49 [Thalictrum thalictroides]